MDILKDKSYKTYDYISRYSSFPIYYNTKDNKYENGITSWLKNTTEYVSIVTEKEETLDSLANYYYGRPDYYWVIADFNRIFDPFEVINKGVYIKIPVLSSIDFEE